jgi:hypothetical protein
LEKVYDHAKVITGKMKFQIIQKILKIVVITLIIFGMLWIGLIILYPNVEFLRNIPFGGLSFLLALIVFPIYLRVR